MSTSTKKGSKKEQDTEHEAFKNRYVCETAAAWLLHGIQIALLAEERIPAWCALEVYRTTLCARKTVRFVETRTSMNLLLYLFHACFLSNYLLLSLSLDHLLHTIFSLYHYIHVYTTLHYSTLHNTINNWTVSSTMSWVQMPAIKCKWKRSSCSFGSFAMIRRL